MKPSNGPGGAWLLRLLAPSAGWREFTRLYVFFRWLDDEVDAPGRDPVAVAALVVSQAALVEGGGAPARPEEAVLVAALRADPTVRAVITPMLAALAFDAARPPGPTPTADVVAQAERVGDAYLLALWRAFAAPGRPPEGLAELARAACLMHLLRDRHIDRALGYDNRPPLPSGGAQADADWVHDVSADAARRFALGRAALGAVPGLRLRLVLRLYAWRYACIDPADPRR